MLTRRAQPLTVLAIILAAVLLVDLVTTASVFAKRRNAPLLPNFASADTARVNWNIDPYPSAANAGFTVKIAEPGRVNSAGKITYRGGAVAPSLNATYVMAALDEANRTGDRRWLRRAETAMDQVLQTSHNGFLPHKFTDTDVFGHALPDPWYSSQAQGLLLSALARLYEVTGNQRWRKASDPVFAALPTFRGFLAGPKPAPEPWLSVVDAAGFLWFEQFTRGQAPVMVLVNQIQTSVGIYDYQRVLADNPTKTDQARRLFAGGVATVTHYAPRTRNPGRISITSLAANQRDPATHAMITRQLRTLSRITGNGSFGALARQFALDDNLPPFNLAKVEIRDPNLSIYKPAPNEASFTVDPLPPAKVTSAGRVSYRDGAVNPGLSASYALAAMDRYDKTGQAIWLSRAKEAVRHVLASSPDGGLLPYRFPNTDIHGSTLPNPWYSSEGQGLLLSALARLSDTTGEAVWRERSNDVFKALTRVRGFGPDGSPPPKAWLSFVDDSGYLWFETYAGGDAVSAVVPGHLATVLGIYDYWRITRNPTAKLLFDGGVTTIEHYLPTIRQEGRTPLYAFSNKSSDPRFEATTTRQLKTLSRITAGLAGLASG